MIIKMMRHGESKANSGELLPAEYGDYKIPLSENGKKQVFSVADKIDSSFLEEAVIYCSPYTRARQSLQLILQEKSLGQNKCRIFEDPRLREIDTGYGSRKDQQPNRLVHGLFYYRYQGGESPADCYDRVSSFLESMYRHLSQSKKNKVFISSHSMVIRCFVMRFLRLSVEEFELIEAPNHWDVITIAPAETLLSPAYSRGGWAVEGLKQKEGKLSPMPLRI